MVNARKTKKHSYLGIKREQSSRDTTRLYRCWKQEGAGARAFRLTDQSSYRVTKKKVPWNAANSTFDASSPAADRHKPFGEPERKKSRKKLKKRNTTKRTGKKKTDGTLQNRSRNLYPFKGSKSEK